MLTIIAIIIALINLIRERDFEAVLYGGVGIMITASTELILILLSRLYISMFLTMWWKAV